MKTGIVSLFTIIVSLMTSVQPLASPSDWAVVEVNKAIESDLVTDTIMSNYRENITREEFAELALKLYISLSTDELPAPSQQPFDDTSNTMVLLASELGIVNGVGDNKFKPMETTTREQIATMIYRTLNILNSEIGSGSSPIAFDDSGDISDWARESISFMTRMDIIRGMGNNLIVPQGVTTREQAILLVWRTFSNPYISEATSPEIEVTDISHAKDTYYYGDEFSLDISIQNRSGEDKELWLGCSLIDPLGKWIDIEPVKFNALGRTLNRIDISEKVDKWITGEYSVRVAVWDKDPSLVQENPVKLDQMDSKETVDFYRQKEYFENWDSDFWIKRDGSIGRSKLNPENIVLNDDGLKIKMPANSLDGGEIQTRKNQSFGSYEVCMKLPDVPSSITGFFLYRAPDFYNEIDIEIFNQSDSEFWLTTYADGAIKNEYNKPLGFDPTEDYHTYRIDYYPDRVSFYVDDKLIQTWKDGFSKRPMKLMVNSWYPVWLDGIRPPHDESLSVKWIKY